MHNTALHWVKFFKSLDIRKIYIPYFNVFLKLTYNVAVMLLLHWEKFKYLINKYFLFADVFLLVSNHIYNSKGPGTQKLE